MSISKKDAFALAVRYDMFNDLEFGVTEPGRIWIAASDLAEIQRKTGVEMLPNKWLDDLAIEYRAKMKHQ